MVMGEPEEEAASMQQVDQTAEMDTSPSPPPTTDTPEQAVPTSDLKPSEGQDPTAEGLTNGVEPKEPRNLELEKYWTAVNANKQDFEAWTYLLQYIEEKADLSELKKAFDEFFLYYPYCYGYWKKYADLLNQVVGTTECMQVYERAVAAIPLSVDIWTNYIDFMKELKPSEEEIRQLFHRAVSASGMDFESDKLWDKYIDWETSLGQLQNVTLIYKQLLSIPTHYYSNHYENLKMHVENNDPSAILSAEELKDMRSKAAEAQQDVENTPGMEALSEPLDLKPNLEGEMTDTERHAVRVVLYDTFHSAFSKNESEVSKRWSFEEGIRRPYFHVKALDKAQLQNWRDYIDFEMKCGSVDQVVVLYERCLIACAMYEEFWLKYTSYLEQLKQLDAAREVFRRACTHHLPVKASIHISWAFFEERIGNFEAASQVMTLIESKAPGNMCVMNHKLNLLRRHGNDLSSLYQEYTSHEGLSIESSTLLTCKYSRYLHKIKNDKLAAIKLLKDRMAVDTTSEQLYIQLLDIEYQQTPINEESVLGIFDMVDRSTTLSAEVKQKFTSRRYEFIDDFGTDVNKLYSQYVAQQTAADEESRKRLADGTTEPDAKKAKSNESSVAVTSATGTTTTAAKAADSTTSAQGYDYYSQQQQGSWAGYYQQQGYGYDSSYYNNQQQWGSGYNYNNTSY